jgi:hypothetical protein
MRNKVIKLIILNTTYDDEIQQDTTSGPYASMKSGYAESNNGNTISNQRVTNSNPVLEEFILSVYILHNRTVHVLSNHNRPTEPRIQTEVYQETLKYTNIV